MLKRYKEYKKVYSNWINEIPTVWEWKKLKEISSFISRGTTPNYAEKGVKVVNQATFSKGYWDIHDVRYTSTLLENSKGFLKNDDILLASTGGGILGKVYHFKEKDEYIADSHVTIIRLRTNCNPKYFYYQFKIKYELINNVLAKGSTNQTELQRQWLRDFQLPIPSRPEQDKIVQYLDWKISEMNRFIHQKKKQIELLEELKTAKINNLITKGLDPNVRYKDSGVEWLGGVPKHWSIDNIKQHFVVNKRIAGKEGYSVLSITQQGIKEKNIASNKGQMAQSYANYQFVYPGDFAMNHMDLLTRYIDISNQFGVTSPDYRVFTLKDTENCYAPFYLRVFQIGYKRKVFYKFGKGAANMGRWRLPLMAFYNYAIQVPPIEEQKQIAEQCNVIEKQIDEMISSIQKEISLVEELKVKLISDVVTGQVDVRDIKIPTYETETDNIESDDDSDGGISAEQIFDESIEEQEAADGKEHNISWK